MRKVRDLSDVMSLKDSRDYLTIKERGNKAGAYPGQRVNVGNFNDDGFKVDNHHPDNNLTSQLFGNTYLHELDLYVTRTLRITDYFRYADDFIFLSRSPSTLAAYLPKLQIFLKTDLQIELHPAKVTIKPIRQGFDFLGFVVLPFHRQVRATTKKRMFRRLASVSNYQSRSSSDLLDTRQSLNS